MILLQLKLVSASYLSGLIISFIYLIICVIKNKSHIHIGAGIIIDFIFWEAAAFGYVYLIYMINGACIRGFAITAMLLGLLTVFACVRKYEEKKRIKNT